MPGKSHPTDSQYRLQEHPYGPPRPGHSEAPSWTDGLPHDFKGWGPRTPDPADPASDLTPSKPDGLLKWDGHEDGHNHHIWRFDGRRRHHH